MTTIKPNLIVKFLGFAKFDTIFFDENYLYIDDVKIDIKTIINYKFTKGMLYNKLEFLLKNNKSYVIQGFPSNAIKKFQKEFDQVFADIYYEFYYNEVSKLISQIPHKEQYWQKQSFRELCVEASKLFQDYKELQVAPTPQQKNKLDYITVFLSKDDSFRKKHNADFYEIEKENFEKYFNTVESKPLTDRQKEAVICNEKNSLILAGAGSGKTSVMVAKAGYLIKRYQVAPENILLLAFNKEASLELKERIKEKLNVEIDSMTFHALGLSIIAEVEGEKPSLGIWAEDEKQMHNLLFKIIQDLMNEDQEFSNDLLEYFQRLYFHYENDLEFKTYGEYIDYIKSIELRSFNGERVKSYEECEIANFLFLNQIQYQYEPVYKFQTASKYHRQYKPDFYLPEYDIYIEHFGIDKDGNTAPYIDTTTYHEGMVWKRALHRHYGTKLLETYSCEKLKGVLTKNLQEKLEKEEVVFKPMQPFEALQFLQEIGLTNSFVKLCATFLTNYKTNNHTIEELKEKAHKVKNKERVLAFLKLFEKIISAYEDHQRNNNVIDFNDMIIKAISYIRNKKYYSKYTHILVDEFQDISLARAEMVKQLIDQHKKSFLCVVGDDWQSINRFAGSDISIVRNFEVIYGDSETIYLDYTFRFNDKISKVSQKFIEKNPYQIKKKIKTLKQIDSKVLFIWWNKNDFLTSLENLLSSINAKSNKKVCTVFILARFWHLIPMQEINRLKKLYKNLQITTLSVHASKGLQADIVIILGNENGRFGFPSIIEDDPIIDLVLAESEDFQFAEERRLFYVAMTRAKSEVHFFTQESNSSVFIKELLEENNQYIEEIGKNNTEELEVCMQCKTGKLILRNAQNSNKQFWGCSNYPYCEYTKPIVYCSKCKNGFMIKKGSSKSYVCSNSTCNYTLPECSKCGAIMIVKQGKYGTFLGCSDYPNCKNTVNIKKF